MSTDPHFPDSRTVDPTSLKTEPRSEPLQDKRLTERLVVLAAVLLFCLPLAWGMFQRELARWHVAAGYAAIFDDDEQAAIASVNRALKWDPDNPEWLLLRAHWKLANSDATGALADAEQLLEIARRQPDNDLQLMMALNTRAYCCALAETDLDSAMDDINEALGLSKGAPEGAMLDTRAYLQLLTEGDYESGLTDATQAVEQYKRHRRETRFLLRRRSQRHINQKPTAHLESELDGAMAVVYFHRGQLYERLGRPEEAMRDRTRALQLGYNPANGVW